MSLKEAVGALRALKAELEATRRAKAELEIVHHEVVEVRTLTRQADFLIGEVRSTLTLESTYLSSSLPSSETYDIVDL